MSNTEINKWAKSIFIAVLLFFLISLYLLIRRGYFNLYIINKTFGSTAIFIAGFTLLVGPLSRHINYFYRFMTIRRHLGLAAFGLAIAHTVASLSQQKQFPFPKWYIEEVIPVAFGLLALVIWTYMTYISRNSKIKELGATIWKKRLSLAGQVGFVAIFLHLVIMKYPGWMRWIRGEVKTSPELANPGYPPASLIVFILAFGVIAYRIIVYFNWKKISEEEKITDEKSIL